VRCPATETAAARPPACLIAFASSCAWSRGPRDQYLQSVQRRFSHLTRPGWPFHKRQINAPGVKDLIRACARSASALVAQIFGMRDRTCGWARSMRLPSGLATKPRMTAGRFLTPRSRQRHLATAANARLRPSASTLAPYRHDAALADRRSHRRVGTAFDAEPPLNRRGQAVFAGDDGADTRPSPRRFRPAERMMAGTDLVRLATGSARCRARVDIEMREAARATGFRAQTRSSDHAACGQAARFS